MALLGSFPAYGRGLVKTFHKIEIAMTDEVFTLFFEVIQEKPFINYNSTFEFIFLFLLFETSISSGTTRSKLRVPQSLLCWGCMTFSISSHS